MPNLWKIKLIASLSSKLTLERANIEQKLVPPVPLKKILHFKEINYGENCRKSTVVWGVGGSVVKMY